MLDQRTNVVFAGKILRNVVLMLAHHLPCWSNNKTTSSQHLVFVTIKHKIVSITRAELMQAQNDKIIIKKS